MGMLTVTGYPASKWITYYVIEEFIQKSQTEKEIKLFVFIYKKWIKNLTQTLNNFFNIDEIFYNCNVFMKYKYNALSIKSYSSDWNDENDMKTETHRTYQKNYIKHL